MQLDRRPLLRGLLTASAAAFVPADAVGPVLPEIVGDGIHDDTDGIQAAVRGRPFVAGGAIVLGQTAILFGVGTFRTTRTIILDSNDIRLECSEMFGTTILCDHLERAFEKREAIRVGIEDFAFERTDAALQRIMVRV